ncbi:hypothetical protein CPB86DRAFT_786052 [Serendipita vermifera]|nr:hypothetical protein CPB86DRAFT_786052 [Serendipita vermifera]
MLSTLRYIAAGVNRHPGAAGVSADGSTLAYGANQYIALWALDERRSTYLKYHSRS